MNITEQLLRSPEASRTDVRASSQGSSYPLSAIVRRAMNPETGLYDGHLTFEGWHSGKGTRTGIVRTDRDAAIRDIERVYPL
jgi:hypothetical protein